MWEFIQFWGRCLVEGWNFADGIFSKVGTLTLLGSAYLFLRKRSEHRRRWEDVTMKIAFWVFVGSFAISTFFVAPFVQYKDASKKPVGATAPKHDLPYERLEGMYSDASNRAYQAEIREARARKEARDNQIKWMEASCATNASPSEDSLIEMRRILQHEQSQINPLDPVQIKRSLDNKRMQGLVDMKQSEQDRLATFRMRHRSIFPIWEHTIIALEAMLSELAKENGGEVSRVVLPTLDDIFYGRQQTLHITLGTNVAWECRCKFSGTEASVGLIMECGTSNGKSDIMEVRSSGDQLAVSLTSDKIQLIVTNCPIASYSNCVELLNDSLGVLVVDQEDQLEEMKH